MKLIKLIFLMVVLAVAFGGYTRKHKRPVYESEPEPEHKEEEKIVDDLGVDNMQPVGDRKCKCLKYCQGICMEAECCETFKAKCRYAKKYPTLTKP